MAQAADKGQKAEKSLFMQLCCCWRDLVVAKACCFYNCIFSPCILCFHATTIYFCACLCIYCSRCFYYFCCCICRTCNCCWFYKDRAFPPNDESLGSVGGDTANAKSGKSQAKVKWVRAGSLASREDIRLFGAKVDPRAICQGALGDCWLLAAMACLAEHDGAVHSLFRTREFNPRGKYKLRLFDGQKGEWVNITIDDWIPCDEKSGKPVFVQPQNNCMWVLLLEKAFAKFCGSFAELEGGHTIWAVKAMTGDPARIFKRDHGKRAWTRSDLVNMNDDKDKRKCGFRSQDEIISDDAMFHILKKYDSLGSILCASGAKEGYGLHNGHAYSILQAIQKDNFRLVQIRNPWGSGEWTGDWSDKSDLWQKHPNVKKACKHTDADDGAFWMSWEDYCKNWDSIGIVDRTVDIHTLKLQVREPTTLGPCKACCRGCGFFWCLCAGLRRLYWPHHTSMETVEVRTGGCCGFCTRRVDPKVGIVG